jgi:hypothetical protein
MKYTISALTLAQVFGADVSDLKDDDKPYPWTIHITPHSHDDVGWLKTLNAYFDGSNKNI